MTVFSSLTTALSGLRDSAARTQAAANNIVNQDTPGYRPLEARATSLVSRDPAHAGSCVATQLLAQEGAVDVGRELARLIVAEQTYKAKVLAEAENLEKTLVDTIG